MLTKNINSAITVLFLAIFFYSAMTTSVNANVNREKPIQPSYSSNELYCLAEAIYFESKHESKRGQEAVGHVVVNRSRSKKFPQTICGVINQKYKTTCQFSYKCDGRSDVPKNRTEFNSAMRIAEIILAGKRDTTFGAVYFHNMTVRPIWAKASKLTITIGKHKFYRA